MLKEAAYQEAAVPLAALVTDSVDEIQLEAIGAELNIFLSERDDNPRVALEALYAFGVLAVEPGGAARRELLRVSGPDLAALIGVPDPALRYAAVRVIGRLFAKRAQDDPIEETVGDAVITALNDSDRTVKSAAMQALGTLRYGRAVQALTDLFQYYGKGEPAEAALDAIARIANSASGPLFTAQLTAKSAALRGIAVEGLARLGDAFRRRSRASVVTPWRLPARSRLRCCRARR
jgi:hypothetical protein